MNELAQGVLLLNKKKLADVLFVSLVAVVGFDISTNFLFPDLRIVIPIVREVLLGSILLLLMRQPRHGDLLWLVATLTTALLMMFFYGAMYFYYPLRTAAVIFVVRQVYQGIDKQAYWGAVVTLAVLLVFNVVFADRILIDQGQRFYAANATVVSVICIYLLVNRKMIVSGVGLIGGLLTGSMAFFVALLGYFGRRPLLIATLATTSVGVALLYLENTQSGERLMAFIDALSSADILTIIGSTTIGTRLEQFDWVLGQHFSHFVGSSLVNQPSSSGLESQILFFYAYGGIAGCAIVLIYAALICWKYYSSQVFDAFLFTVLLLYAMTLRIFESFATIFYLSLAYEAVRAQRQLTKLRIFDKDLFQDRMS